MNIITRHEHPPIPGRSFDWCAQFDGEEDGPYGWGATEEEAIADLKQQAEEWPHPESSFAHLAP